MKEAIDSSLEGIHDRITSRVHNLMKESAQAQEAWEGQVPAPGVST